MKRRFLRVLPRMSCAFLSILMLTMTTSCFPMESRQRELWRIPDGYQGWIYSRWGTPTCPVFPVRGEYRVIDVPASGVVCTSSPLEEGVAKDRFVFASADGKEVEIPPSRAHTRVFEKGSNNLFVFIGSEEDFGRVRPSPPASYGP